ncbi:hypothetical protein C8R44DRAFT_751115 [Mycena epipterygia]|nr:hypothetical protein C8R44DRAFT_751115 [Mycena epipterygia]
MGGRNVFRTNFALWHCGGKRSSLAMYYLLRPSEANPPTIVASGLCGAQMEFKIQKDYVRPMLMLHCVGMNEVTLLAISGNSILSRVQPEWKNQGEIRQYVSAPAYGATSTGFLPQPGRSTAPAICIDAGDIIWWRWLEVSSEYLVWNRHKKFGTTREVEEQFNKQGNKFGQRLQDLKSV